MLAEIIDKTMDSETERHLDTFFNEAFRKNINSMQPNRPEDFQELGQRITPVKLRLTAKETFAHLVRSTDEGYGLEVETREGGEEGEEVEVTVTADTFFGLRHGLETLSQLVSWNQDRQCLQVTIEREIERE